MLYQAWKVESVWLHLHEVLLELDKVYLVQTNCNSLIWLKKIACSLRSSFDSQLAFIKLVN